MAMDNQGSKSEAGRGAWMRRLVQQFALQDWLVTVYLTVLFSAVLTSGDSPVRGKCLAHTGLLLGICVVSLVLVRGSLIKDGIVAPLLYRLGVFLTVNMSYFVMRDLLPQVSPYSLDAQLWQFDEQILHFEPALWMDRFVNPLTAEWFSFFYLCYFIVLVVHIVPMVFFSRRAALLAEFSLGLLLIYTAAHTLYMIVPGYGPVRYLADHFQHDLPDGFWVRSVLDTVESGGAQKDIFPSLHTGAPVLISLFSFRHRDKMPFKYTWPFMAFFAINIVIATMFLRWHYLIDVIAGLALATVAHLFAGQVAPNEVGDRKFAGRQPVWILFFLPGENQTSTTHRPADC
jgi:membrane-associated phospholipid phosphatase